MIGIFFEIFKMSIQASWLILAVLLLRFLLKKAPKWTLCVLWSMVAIRLVVPYSIQSVFSVLPQTPTFEVAETVTDNQNTEHVSDAITNHPTYEETDNDVPLKKNPYLTYEDVKPQMQKINVIVWLGGMCVTLLYAMFGYVRVLLQTKQRLLLFDQVYLCDRIESPFLFGVIRPKIYVPSALTSNEQKHVVAHEQAHLKRLDHIWKPIGYLLLAVHWFNPLVWIAYHLFCRDIEFACDEKVIRSYSHDEIMQYTKTLLKCSTPRGHLSACPVAFGESNIKQRIKSVLQYKKPTRYLIVGVLVLCMICVVCFLTDPIKIETFQRIELIRYETTPGGPSDPDRAIGLFTKVTSTTNESVPSRMPIYEIIPHEIDDPTWSQFLTYFDLPVSRDSTRVEENGSFAERSKNEMKYCADCPDRELVATDEEIIKKAKAILASMDFIQGEYECDGIFSRRIYTEGEKSYTTSKSVRFYRLIDGKRVYGDTCYIRFSADGLCEFSACVYEYKDIGNIPLLSVSKAIDKIKRPDHFYIDEQDVKLTEKADTLRVETIRLFYENQYIYGCTILQPVYGFSGYAENKNEIVPFKAEIIAVPEKYTYKDDSNERRY